MTTTVDHLRRRDDLVHVYGHRGARGVFPENTMPGFRYVLDIGLKAVEVDVLASRDGIAVLTHNPRLWADTTRDMGGDWLDEDGPLICQLSFRALQAYDVGGIRPGSAYAQLFPDQAALRGTSVPSLEALCALVAPKEGFWLNLEIKSFADQPLMSPEPAQLVAAVLEPLRLHGLERRTIVQSFDWRVMRALSVQAPEIVRAYLTQLRIGPADGRPGANIYPGSPWLDGRELSGDERVLPQAVAELGGRIWCPFYRDVTAVDVACAHELGLLVNVWTANEEDDLARMVDLGVDGIITDFPARAQKLLAARGLHWCLPDGTGAATA